MTHSECSMPRTELREIHNSSLKIHHSPSGAAALPNDELRVLNAEWLFSLTNNSSFIIHNSPLGVKGLGYGM